MAAKAQGLQAALVFCVQHSGINRVAPALDIDPAYGARLAEAQEQGVMIKAFKVSFRLPYAAISKPVPVCLGPRADCREALALVRSFGVRLGARLRFESWVGLYRR